MHGAEALEWEDGYIFDYINLRSCLVKCHEQEQKADMFAQRGETDSLWLSNREHAYPSIVKRLENYPEALQCLIKMSKMFNLTSVLLSSGK